MEIKIRKTTNVNTTVNWNAVLKDDKGSQFASMSGTANATHPFGTTALTVHNQAAFAANKEAAQEAYAQFCDDFAAMVETINPTVTTIEGDELNEGGILL